MTSHGIPSTHLRHNASRPAQEFPNLHRISGLCPCGVVAVFEVTIGGLEGIVPQGCIRTVWCRQHADELNPELVRHYLPGRAWVSIRAVA